MMRSQSAQHLERSRANIFGGGKRTMELDFGSDWVKANGPAFFDYGDHDEDDDIEDDEGLVEEPHHLLNVDRDSSDSGELIEHDSDSDDHEGEKSKEEERGEGHAEHSMEESDTAEHGITLSSPQRGIETAASGGEENSSADSSADSPPDSPPDSPSRSALGTTATTGKAADPFLAFVAGRRSQDLSKLQVEQQGRIPALPGAASKRTRLWNGRAAPQQGGTAEKEEEEEKEREEDEQDSLQSPNGNDDEEMMTRRILSKGSGDWSQLNSDDVCSESGEDHDGFVQV